MSVSPRLFIYGWDDQRGKSMNDGSKIHSDIKWRKLYSTNVVLMMTIPLVPY